MPFDCSRCSQIQELEDEIRLQTERIMAGAAAALPPPQGTTGAHTQRWDECGTTTRAQHTTPSWPVWASARRERQLRRQAGQWHRLERAALHAQPPRAAAPQRQQHGPAGGHRRGGQPLVPAQHLPAASPRGGPAHRQPERAAHAAAVQAGGAAAVPAPARRHGRARRPCGGQQPHVAGADGARHAGAAPVSGPVAVAAAAAAAAAARRGRSPGGGRHVQVRGVASLTGLRVQVWRAGRRHGPPGEALPRWLPLGACRDLQLAGQQPQDTAAQPQQPATSSSLLLLPSTSLGLPSNGIQQGTAAAAAAHPRAPPHSVGGSPFTGDHPGPSTSLLPAAAGPMSPQPATAALQPMSRRSSLVGKGEPRASRAPQPCCSAPPAP